MISKIFNKWMIKNNTSFILDIFWNMGMSLNYYVLRIIFQYLNGFDLFNASKVCRSWLEVADDEKQTRGPMCIIKTKDSKLESIDYEIILKENIKCCKVKPSLSMLFIKMKNKEDIAEKCYCKYLPFNWYSPVVVSSYLPAEEKNTVLCMFFPEVPNIKITTLTLVPYKLIWGNGIYCHEIKTNFNFSFSNADRLKTVFESVFSFDQRTESCMILLCDRNGALITTNLENALRSWFPNKRLPVWGGIVDYLSICHHMPHTASSEATMSCIAVLISGEGLNTWSTFLYCNCNTQKQIEKTLKCFKDKITLKKHSIGFLFNPQFRNFLFCLESTIFKQIFPGVPLVEYSGIGAFGGNDGEPYTRIINKLNLFEKTAFMVITYD